MSNYHRNYAPGGTHVFTVNLEDRNLRLLTENIELVRGAFRYTHARRPFTIAAMVVLPAICTQSGLCPKAMRIFPRGGYFPQPQNRRDLIPKSPAEARTRNFATSFLGGTIRDEADFASHVNYIHYNPVKHGHAHDQAAWPYSSYRRWAALNAP